MKILDLEEFTIYPVAGHWLQFDEAWWVDGNGSCDCNRALVCDIDHGEDGICSGQWRFVLIRDDETGLLPGFNDGYPQERLREAVEFLHTLHGACANPDCQLCLTAFGR